MNPGDGPGLPQRLLRHDLKAVAVASGDDAEAGDADLAGETALEAALEQGQLLFGGGGIELEHDLVAHVDAGFAQQGQVGRFSASALPDEIEAVAALAAAGALGGVGAWGMGGGGALGVVWDKRRFDPPGIRPARKFLD